MAVFALDGKFLSASYFELAEIDRIVKKAYPCY